MGLAKHKVVTSYRTHRSTAHSVLSRMRRREEMAKKKEHRKSTKTESQKPKAAELPPEKYFVLQDGTAIKSVSDLAMMMDNISDDNYNFHVTEEKNDFSNWIRDVFNDHELAESLLSVKDKKESQIMLLKHSVSKTVRG